MNPTEWLVLISLFLVAWSPTSEMPRPARVMVEICDNALDDDGDGRIDLNDPDCDCPPPRPPSLIPNPSFEDRDCCPGSSSQMYCAKDWIQASVPTTDYVHTCGWTGWEGYEAPLPLPDGEGAIGFRNGRPGENGNGPQANWKEYAGACLYAPLRVGKYYRIEFYVGFASSRNSPPVDVSFFGASSCDALPFDEEDAGFGCPTNGLGWSELARVRVGGVNTWVKAAVEFTPREDMHALVIGPSCGPRPSEEPLYYFLDDLVLAQLEDFNYEIRSSGNPCTGEAILEAPQLDTFSYQWYRDGIALVGETGPNLENVTEEGFYRVRLSGPTTCSLTESYYFSVPFTTTTQKVNICAGDSYSLNGKELFDSGTYIDTLKTAANCDSIVQIDLTSIGGAPDTVRAKIFDSESWSARNYNLDEPGHYNLRFRSQEDCDSMIYLILDRYDVYLPNAFSPNGDGVNDYFTISGGPDLVEIEELRIFNRWGAQLFSRNQLTPGSRTGSWDGRSRGQALPPGVYIYQAKLRMDDGQVRVVKGSVALMR